jgi:Flp pilus assembly pilin Flp
MTAAIRMMRDYLDARLGGREEGQGMVEYTLILGTISIVIVAAFLTTGITAAIGGLATDIGTAINPPAP